MTFMQPDAVAVVFAVASHGIVGEVALSDLKVGIYYDLREKENKTGCIIIIKLHQNMSKVSLQSNHDNIFLLVNRNPGGFSE